MLTVLALLARKFNKRLVLAFGLGVVAGAVVLALLLANHLRHVCNPLSVPGLVLCKVV
jgi:hypothetical protein